MVVTRYLVLTLSPWILKSVLYAIAFRKRRIKATFLTVLIIAATPMLVGALLMMLPMSPGASLSFVLTVIAAVYLCKKYTDGTLYPDIIAIVLGIEALSTLIISYVIVPLIS
jgi:hypothetical protein